MVPIAGQTAELNGLIFCGSRGCFRLKIFFFHKQRQAIELVCIKTTDH